MVKKMIAILASLFAFALLTACGDTVSIEKARQMSADAAAAEANKTDAKLANAKAEVGKIAVNAARQGGYSAQANCNVLPAELARTQAARDFPTNVGILYKEACGKEVVAMNAERQRMKNQAVANAKAKEQKLAAKRQKAEELATKQQKRRHVSTMQPIRQMAPQVVAKPRS